MVTAGSPGLAAPDIDVQPTITVVVTQDTCHAARERDIGNRKSIESTTFTAADHESRFSSGLRVVDIEPAVIVHIAPKAVRFCSASMAASECASVIQIDPTAAVEIDPPVVVGVRPSDAFSPIRHTGG